MLDHFNHPLKSHPIRGEVRAHQIEDQHVGSCVRKGPGHELPSHSQGPCFKPRTSFAAPQSKKKFSSMRLFGANLGEPLRVRLLVRAR